MNTLARRSMFRSQASTSRTTLKRLNLHAVFMIHCLGTAGFNRGACMKPFGQLSSFPVRAFEALREPVPAAFR